ncbi:MAG: nuclear transport factor 2 family protein [Acidimicrobiia bacterium]
MSGHVILDEVAARLDGPAPGDGQLAELAAWLPEAAGKLDLAAARDEAARTGRSAVVAYRPGGPVLGLRCFPPGEATDVHAHAGWGIAHVLEGANRYERFARLEDSEPYETAELTAGDTVWWTDPPGDVHRQTGTGDGAVELVLLARDHLTLPERAARCLGTLAYDSLAQFYAPDVLLDADVPKWRFQLQGGAAILDVVWRDELALPGVQVTSYRWMATVGGGVVVQREARYDGDDGEHRWRDVHVLRVEDGWIIEHAISCTGIWGPATIARQAAEAPMVTR